MGRVRWTDCREGVHYLWGRGTSTVWEGWNKADEGVEV
jgi:hypothetical protein